MTKNTLTKIMKAGEKEVITTHIFDAPIGLVFRTYTDPKMIDRWWGPRRLSTRVEKMDVRPGGAWRFIQKDTDGMEYDFNGIYREVVYPERLTYTFNYEAMPGHESVDSITFEETGGKTKLTEKSLFLSVDDRDEMLKEGMEEGVIESMDRFAELLKELQRDNETGKKNVYDLVIDRVFDAPLDLVWKTWTERESIMKWWGPKGFTSPSCRIDFRIGGDYLYCMRWPDGHDYWSTGVFLDIIPKELITATDCFADEKGNIVPASYYGMSSDFPMEFQLTVRFEEQGGRTKLSLHHMGFMSDTDQTNAGLGWNESLDKFAEALKSS